MKKTLFFCLISSLFLLSSCASFHSGSVGGGSAVITNAQFYDIDFAYGTAQTVHVLGFGGMNKAGLVHEAKKDLYRNYPLSPGQAIGQTTVDFKRSLYPFVLITKVMVSAEIIDFSNPRQNVSSTKRNVNKFESGVSHTVYSSGDTVAFSRDGQSHKCIVVEQNGRIATIQYTEGIYKGENKDVPSRLLSLYHPPKKGETRFFTPQNPDPDNKLVTFRYKGNEYIGELTSKNEDYFVVRMENSDGKKIGLYIRKDDILD
jgi:hypothetical protein